MNAITLNIENIKCHGCANLIHKELRKIPGVDHVDVWVEENTVTIGSDGSDEVITACRNRLNKLGYPEAGKNTTMNRARSYVSCAIGRMTDPPDLLNEDLNSH
jgi:copper chaperone